MSLELDDLDRAVAQYWAARVRRLKEIHHAETVRLPGDRSGGLDSDGGQGDDHDTDS